MNNLFSEVAINFVFYEFQNFKKANRMFQSNLTWIVL